MVHILPHWNWERFQGKSIPVWCYSNAESVELFLNGQSLGERRMADGAMNEARQETKGTGWYHVAWEVPWQAGTLKAVAKHGARVIATDEVSTAGKPARLALSVDRKSIKADGQDLAYVMVKILDEAGRVCPDAANLVKFTLSGPGKIAGLGNGDATCHEDFQGDRHSAFHGLCLAVLQSGRGKSGALRLKAEAEGLVGAEVDVETENR